MDWNDDQIVAFDFEASGSLPEYALQPWRIPAGDTWATSLAWVHRPTTGEVIIDGGLFPTVAMMRRFLEWVLDEGKIILGWNVVYDIAVMLGYGFEELVMQCRFMDGMLIWRHLDIEPEWDETGRTKRHYGLKLAVDTFLPQYSGYQEDIDFHTDDVEKLTKLHDYNIKDNIFTLRIAKMLWGRLTQRQQQAAIIEAQCLPLVALANYRGMCIDRIAARELSATLKNTAKVKLAKLAPHGVNEIIIRSPTKLAKLMFDDWKLPVLKENKSDKTQKISRSTDKAVLHELAFIDPRAKELREYREALNCDTKFALAPIKASEYCGDDRAHPQAIVYSTYCVPGDVEVLTRNGWVRLDQWQGGEIVQARPDLSMEFLPATRYDGGETSDWVRLKQQSFDCLFTPEHTVPYLAQKTYAWRVQKAGELSNEVKNIPTAGYLRLAGRYTPDQMRLFAAVQADGYFGRYELKFTLKKARKIKRLLQLLMTLGIRYRTYVAAAYPDRLEVHIGKKQQPDWLWKDKKFFGAWLLDTTIDGLATFVEETEFWDGSPHRDGGFKYSSSIKDNVEWVVTVAALVGRKAAIHKTDICGMSECHISDPSQRAIRAITPHYRSRVCETHHAYCPSTETGFWLARSQGHIFITGNTGRLTYASKQGRNKDERPIGWAVHQEKRGAPFRRILVPPPGYDLIEFDAAGQEFRWMAIKSGDPVMLHLCAPGEDPHSYMGLRSRIAITTG